MNKNPRDLPPPPDAREIERLMHAAERAGASDLHLKAGRRPTLRIDTELRELSHKELTPKDTRRLIWEIMTDAQRACFQVEQDLDFAYDLPGGGGRFRISVFMEKGDVAVAARRVRTSLPSFEGLNLPPGVRRLADFEEGLVILAGATGSGKSTTLACVINHIRENEKLHILTIEDPIEYRFPDSRSFINQREIGIDVPDWHQALKHMVRQDPDVIMIGEMRDHVSFEAALTAAETGHLVFTTIHASGAAQTVGRVLDLFPSDRQGQIRQSLAFNLRAIACQRLMPSCREGVKVVPAVELLFNSPMAQKLLVNGEDEKLPDLIRSSKQEGMQDFNMSLLELIEQGLVSKETAQQHSPNPDQLLMNLQGIYLTDQNKILG